MMKKSALLLCAGLSVGCSMFSSSSNDFYTIDIARGLSESIVVNKTDIYISLDEVLAEVNKFDEHDSVAKNIHDSIYPMLKDIRDELSKEKGSHELCVHQNTGSTIRSYVRALEFIPPPNAKHPFALLLSSLLKEMSYASIDEYYLYSDVYHSEFIGVEFKVVRHY